MANRSLPDWLNVVLLSMPGLIGGFGGVIQHIGLIALRRRITPAHLLGRVYASAGVLGSLMAVIGALAGGCIGEAIGLRPAFVVLALGYEIP